jgi:hypothetical protein
VRIPVRRVIAKARRPLEGLLDNARPDGSGVLTGDGVVRFERLSDRPAATSQPEPGRCRQAGGRADMDHETHAATHNITDNATDGPVRYAGVDWSWSDHAVCVIDDAGAAVQRLTVTHSAAGLAKLVTLLHRHQVLGVAIERGDGPVVQALLDAGLTVFVVPSRACQVVCVSRSRVGQTR